jgi:flagellar hook-basal body complex protein FliE
MSDPLGLIGTSTPLQRGMGISAPSGGAAGPAGNMPSFKDALQSQINQVNELQSAATAAMEDLATGRRDDVESVIIATQKADIAFKMLLQVRNKVMDAYEEVKQMRV